MKLQGTNPKDAADSTASLFGERNISEVKNKMGVNDPPGTEEQIGSKTGKVKVPAGSRVYLTSSTNVLTWIADSSVVVNSTNRYPGSGSHHADPFHLLGSPVETAYDSIAAKDITSILTTNAQGYATVPANLMARLLPPDPEGSGSSGQSWGWSGSFWGWLNPNGGGGGSGGMATYSEPTAPQRNGQGVVPPVVPLAQLPEAPPSGITKGNQQVWVVVKSLPVAELGVDANRDSTPRFLSENNSDQTSSTNAFRFWVNDDVDRFNVEFPLVEDDADRVKEQANANYKDLVINGKRDLEDFQRLWIRIKEGAGQLHSGMKFGLKWKNATGTPKIKVYRAVETDGGRKYLEDENKAVQQISGDFGKVMTIVVGTNSVPIDNVVFADLTVANPRGYLLFEGAGEGKGELVPVVLDQNNNEIAECGPGIWIELKQAKDMFETWTVGEGNGSGQMPSALPQEPVGFKYDANSPEENKMMVFVHGWNMTPWEKDNFSETAYKRLYHQGYKGRFASFRWPTAYGGWLGSTAIANARYSERIAWSSSVPLAALLSQFNTQCPGQVYLFAHSMGNMVAGEALRRNGLAGVQINTYVACQSAMAASLYDAAANTNHALDFQGAGPTTPDIYSTWLAGNSAGVVRRFNFANGNDFALGGLWEQGQREKPTLLAFQFLYGYTGSINEVEDGFWKDTINSWGYQRIPMLLGGTANVLDRYEIMAYGAESRSMALGRDLNPISGFTGNLDVRTIWPADLKEHKDRQWHSGEFRFNNMQQREFWRQLLIAFDLTP